MDLVSWITISRALTPGSTAFRKLYDKFGSAEAILAAEDYEISRAIGEKSEEYNRLIARDRKDAQNILEQCEKKRIRILTFDDPDFPEPIRSIKNPPVLLYCFGVLPDFKRHLKTAVVGTRSMSEYGSKNTYQIAFELSVCGSVIVSGLARGIDTVALTAATVADGMPVGIIGSGIDRLYPKENRDLAAAMVKRGCILSEYAPGVEARPYHFPQRNRLISALSDAVLVMEGSVSSGAMITAKYAKDQRRTLYALPGSIGQQNAEGPVLLIRSGAKVLTSAHDVIADFENKYIGTLNPVLPANIRMPDRWTALNKYVGYPVPERSAKTEYKESDFSESYPEETKPKERQKSEKAPSGRISAVRCEADLSGLSEKQKQIFHSIPEDESVPFDMLVVGEITSKDVLRSMTVLEMAGLVEILPGERVKRK